MGFNGYEQLPHKGDPTRTNVPGTAKGFNSGSDALPGGFPARDNKYKDKSTNLLNDQSGGLGEIKGP